MPSGNQRRSQSTGRSLAPDMQGDMDVDIGSMGGGKAPWAATMLAMNPQGSLGNDLMPSTPIPMQPKGTGSLGNDVIPTAPTQYQPKGTGVDYPVDRPPVPITPMMDRKKAPWYSMLVNQQNY